MDFALLGKLFYVAGAIVFLGTVLALPSLKLAAAFFRWMFWSTTHYDRPQPVISPAKAMRVQDKFYEALEYLDKIVATYPDLAVGFIEIMDIYATDLKDRKGVENTYERALKTVKDKEERLKLDSAYKDLMAD